MSMFNHTLYTVSHFCRQNTRPNLNKPNEDYCITDTAHGIFLLADGVTRPHEEYRGEPESLSGICARELCQRVHDQLLTHLSDPPEEALYQAMLAGNRHIRDLNQSYTGNRPPSATFAGAILRGSMLTYSTCCDTVAYLIRNGAKIQLSEYHNYAATKLGYSRDEVYRTLHNNPLHPDGFGLFNGDPRLSHFLRVTHIALEPGDRIILSSDGLAECLRVLRGNQLKAMSPEELLTASLPFDQPPFGTYADDKCCIVIDIPETEDR